MRNVKFLYLLIISLLLAKQSLAHEAFEYSKHQVEVSSNISISLDVYKPIAPLKTKALIVVSPGSSGLGDLCAGEFLNDKTVNFHHRCGLVKIFVDKGYAVAFYSQRGLLRLSECLQGDDFESRRQSYPLNCYLPEVRKELDLYTTTDDTEKVYAFLSKLFEKNLAVISLPTSEGSYHISKLVGSGKIKPVGVVLAGGVYGSLKEAWDVQKSYTHYFEKIEATFKRFNKDVISLNEIIEVNYLDSDYEHQENNPSTFRRFLGLEVTSRNKIDLFYNMALKNKRIWEARVADLDYLSPLSDDFYGAATPNYKNINYLRQMLASTEKLSDSYKGFPGKVIYVYGAFDRQMKIPPEGNCGIPQTACQVKILQHVGHGLEDASGEMPASSLNQLLDSVNEVYEYSRAHCN
jgi:hypothetical protein